MAQESLMDKWNFRLNYYIKDTQWYCICCLLGGVVFFENKKPRSSQNEMSIDTIVRCYGKQIKTIIVAIDLNQISRKPFRIFLHNFSTNWSKTDEFMLYIVLWCDTKGMC